MSFKSELRRKVRQSAQANNIGQEKLALATKAHALTCELLSDWGAMTAGGQLGLESLGNDRINRNTAFDALQDADTDALVRGLKSMNMADRHVEQVSEQVLTQLDAKFSARDVLAGGQQVTGMHAPMSMVVGRSASGRYGSDNGVGLEAFGDDINRLNTDDRLTMDLIIMRPAENIMDKALARVSDSSPVVTIKVPSPEAFDWAKTQEANSTVESRHGASNTYKMRDLYRNPAHVNSAPKRIVAQVANDSGDVLWDDDAPQYYKTAKKVSLLDLSRIGSNFTYDSIDRTDLVSDGAFVDAVIVQINDGTDTEAFKLDTSVFDLAIFNASPSSKDSGQRQVILDGVMVIGAGTKTFDGSTSAIAAKLTDAKVQASFRLTATLNIKTGVLEGSGTVDLKLLQLADGTAISGATNTLFGGMTSNLVAYSVDARFDEENMRKANLSLWVNYYEMQFVVPRGRIYFTDYSLSQDVDENAIAFTSSVVALGNGRRGLDTIVDSLNDIAAGQAYAVANPEVVSFNTISEQSFAASLVKPTVVTTSIDFDQEDIANMNESTRLVEIHGRFRARLLMMATALFAKSLMLNQYKAGERPVLKCWVHSAIADIVIGITDYYPELNDKEATATGADYSMVLPNGYRLDVIKSNFDCLQNRCYIVPVIESDMDGILSAASIRDCGTVSTNYIPTINGASTRRFATTSREIVMVSNRVGLCIEVKGLQTQLGTVGHTPLPLGANYTEELSV